MKDYYYCNANMGIYTEKEKEKSKLPAFRFEKIGCFASRKMAEIHANFILWKDVVTLKRYY